MATFRGKFSKFEREDASFLFFSFLFFCRVVQNLPCHGRWIYSKFLLLQCYLSAIVKDREKVSGEAICRHIFSYLLTMGIKLFEVAWISPGIISLSYVERYFDNNIVFFYRSRVNIIPSHVSSFRYENKQHFQQNFFKNLWSFVSWTGEIFLDNFKIILLRIGTIERNNRTNN